MHNKKEKRKLLPILIWYFFISFIKCPKYLYKKIDFWTFLVFIKDMKNYGILLKNSKKKKNHLPIILLLVFIWDRVLRWRKRVAKNATWLVQGAFYSFGDASINIGNGPLHQTLGIRLPPLSVIITIFILFFKMHFKWCYVTILLLQVSLSNDFYII